MEVPALTLVCLRAGGEEIHASGIYREYFCKHCHRHSYIEKNLSFVFAVLFCITCWLFWQDPWCAQVESSDWSIIPPSHSLPSPSTKTWSLRLYFNKCKITCGEANKRYPFKCTEVINVIGVPYTAPYKNAFVRLTWVHVDIQDKCTCVFGTSSTAPSCINRLKWRLNYTLASLTQDLKSQIAKGCVTAMTCLAGFFLSGSLPVFTLPHAIGQSCSCVCAYACPHMCARVCVCVCVCAVIFCFKW